MLKKRLTTLVFCLFGGVFIVAALYVLSFFEFNYGNGFIRKLPSHEIRGYGFIKTNGKSLYFAGGDTNTVYLGNWYRPAMLLKIEVRTKDTLTLKITGVDTVKLHLGVFVRTSQKGISLLDGLKPIILSGDLATVRLTHVLKPQYFTAALALGSDQYVLRVAKNGQKNILVKLDRQAVNGTYPLKQQGNGIFSTDGMMVSSPDKASIFYIYYYRNAFISLDSSLRLKYNGKTIDTVAHQQINAITIKSAHQRTLAAPPVMVNKHADANGKWLFIQSGIKAGNELSSVIEQSAIIDVYSEKDGKYHFSFYVDNFDHERMRDFRVYGQTLIALYDHYLYFYHLNF